MYKFYFIHVLVMYLFWYINKNVTSKKQTPNSGFSKILYLVKKKRIDKSKDETKKPGKRCYQKLHVNLMLMTRFIQIRKWRNGKKGFIFGRR